MLQQANRYCHRFLANNPREFGQLAGEQPELLALQMHTVSVQPRRRKIQMSEVSIQTAALKKSEFLFGIKASNAQAGSSTVNRGHEHHRSRRRLSVCEGRPRCLGGVQRGGGT